MKANNLNAAGGRKVLELIETSFQRLVTWLLAAAAANHNRAKILFYLHGNR